MELAQRIEIPLPPATIWAALNDPDILQRSLPGCEKFVLVGEDQYEIQVRAKVGPVKATFNGEVTLKDIDPPNSYKLEGGGKGGVAGFAKGGAKVTLQPSDQGTIMTYSVQASVGGKLAQIGARLVNGAAKKMANDFFTGFVRICCNNPDMEIELVTIEGEEN